MKAKTLITVAVLLFAFTMSFAQTKVLTTGGRTFTTPNVAISDESISFAADGKNQTILKNNVLAVVPEGKSAYTFRVKNGKKQTIKKKDMHNNYTGSDKPRMFAYKYMGTESNVSKLYVLNADASMNQDQFKNIFNEQQKKFKTRNVVAIGAAVLALGVGAASLASANKDASNLQNSLR